MKKFLRFFALTTLLLMGSVTTMAGKLLTYDFTTNYPSADIRIDEGNLEIRGENAYWAGKWAGLFGRKIAFEATSAYCSLKGGGGLADFHDHQKIYIKNLSAGDKITIYYGGTDALLEFSIKSTATFEGLTQHYDSIVSGRSYRVTGDGDFIAMNKYKSGVQETIISRIVVESVITQETMELKHGMCTFTSRVPLDFSQVTTAKAYVATGFSNGKFTFKRVKYVPSDTGFLVVANDPTTKSLQVPVGRSANYQDNAVAKNLFQPILANQEIVMTEGIRYFILGVSNHKMGIYELHTNHMCEANKSYLLVDE